MKNILFIDDDKNFLTCLEEGFGFYSDLNLVTAGNGEEAIEKVESREFDLVVTDLRMPLMDGFQLIEFLKNHYPHIPIIVVSALSDPETARKLKPFSVSMYIDKPVDLDEIVTGVTHVLNCDGAAGLRGDV